MTIPAIDGSLQIPWYKQPLVWMVIAIPASAVVVGMVMLWLSIVSFDGMVADDYYKQGMQINRVLDRQRVAAASGLSAQLVIEAQGARVQLNSRSSSFKFPKNIQLHLSYATRDGHDQTLSLARVQAASGNEYAGRAAQLAPGRWYVSLSAGEQAQAWRLNSVLTMPASGVVTFDAGAGPAIATATDAASAPVRAER